LDSSVEQTVKDCISLSDIKVSTRDFNLDDNSITKISEEKLFLNLENDFEEIKENISKKEEKE
jgi:hypothetical protein